MAQPDTSPGSRQTQGRSAVRPDRRWLILVVVAVAQLMVVLDATIVNIALPSAQHALGFANSDRQPLQAARSPASTRVARHNRANLALAFSACCGAPA
jgi:hypothetical protein